MRPRKKNDTSLQKNIEMNYAGEIGIDWEHKMKFWIFP